MKFGACVVLFFFYLDTFVKTVEWTENMESFVFEQGSNATLTCNQRVENLTFEGPCDTILTPDKYIHPNKDTVGWCKEHYYIKQENPYSRVDFATYYTISDGVGNIVFDNPVHTSVGLFRDRTLYVKGNLTIYNVTFEDSGVYACAYYTGHGYMGEKVNLTVMHQVLIEPAAKPLVARETKSAEIIGLGICLVVGITIVAMVTLYKLRNRCYHSPVEPVINSTNPAYIPTHVSLRSASTAVSLDSTDDSEHYEYIDLKSYNSESTTYLTINNQ